MVIIVRNKAKSVSLINTVHHITMDKIAVNAFPNTTAMDTTHVTIKRVKLFVKLAGQDQVAKFAMLTVYGIQSVRAR